MLPELRRLHDAFSGSAFQNITGGPLNASRAPTLRSEASESRVFVGREAELLELLAGLDEVRSGQGRLFLVGGEPGIGKTRLSDEVAAHASRRGVLVLWGRCWEAGGAPAYWPWVQLIRSYIQSCDPADLRAQLGRGAPFLAQILPELDEIVPDMCAPPAIDAEGARFRLFEAVATLLRNAAEVRPLAFVLDDLHVADAPSLLLLRFLARELPRTRILVIGTYRNAEVGHDHPLSATLAEAAREPETRNLLLGGLGQGEVGRFLEVSAGMKPPMGLVRAVYAATEGNPLFLREVVQLLAHEGRLGEGCENAQWVLNVPPGVRQVIGRRIADLSEPCKRILTLASVLGREFDSRALERLSDEPREVLWQLVDEAVTAGVVNEIPGTLGRLRFHHALIRDVLYQDLTPSRRVRLHRRAGTALEALYGAEAEPHLAELAYHFFEASGIGGDGAEQAIGYARAAADRAARLLAFEEAARLYELALQALEHRRPAEPELACELLLSLGDAQMRANDEVAGYVTFRKAADLARGLRSPSLLARAALGHGGRFVWGRSCHNPTSLHLLREALAAADLTDHELRARMLARLAGALRDEPTGEERHALSEEGVQIARRLRDPGTLAYALDGRYAATWEPGNAEERLSIATELTEVAELAGDPERVVQAHHYRLIALLELGDLPAAYAALEAKAKAAEDLAQPAHRWYVAVMRACLALFAGRIAEAEELAHLAKSLHHPDSWNAAVSFEVQLFAIRREQGRLNEVEELIRRAAAEHTPYPMFRGILAVLYVEVGREADARRVFETAAAQDFSDLPWDCEWLFATTLLAEVASALGDVPRAALLYRLIGPYARFNVVAPAEISTGSASRSLGLLAATLSRWDEAAEHFEVALAMNRSMGAAPMVARTQYDYAAMLLRRGSPERAAQALELLGSASATAGELGLVALAEQIQQLRSGTGRSRRGAAGARTGQVHPFVFRREGEIWTVSFESEACRLKDRKGLRYVARLLAAPGREIHSLELVASEAGPAEPDACGIRLHDARIRRTPTAGDSGAILDSKAKACYRERLLELEEEIEEATAWGDAPRAERAAEERESLLRQISAAMGLGGRDRRAGSDAERARVSVTRAIKSALDRLQEHCPALGAHLEATVRTGTFCSYTPDTRVPLEWKL